MARKDIDSQHPYTLTLSCDDRSRLEKVTDNANLSINFIYDNAGNITSTETRSSDGSLTLLVESLFENRNRLTATISPHGDGEASIVQMILDPEDNLETLTDPKSQSTSNVYD